MGKEMGKMREKKCKHFFVIPYGGVFVHIFVLIKDVVRINNMHTHRRCQPATGKQGGAQSVLEEKMCCGFGCKIALNMAEPDTTLG